MNSFKPLLIVSFLTFTIFTSCDHNNQNLSSDNNHLLAVNSDTKNSKEISEIPPSDNWLFKAQLDESVSWKEVDEWYNDKLHELKDKDYFRNLKSIAFFTLVETKPAFLKEADLDKLLFYAHEDRKMHREGGLKIMAKLYERIAFLGANTEAANLAHAKINVLQNEYDQVSISKEDYIEKHKDSYDKIRSLQYDRWGKPLYESK